MIGSSLYGALAYNQEKVQNNQAYVIGSNRIRETVNGDFTTENCLASFAPYLAANRRTKLPIMHISLNPHPKDKLSDEQMQEIATEYLDKLGYANQPYLIYKHTDIDRHHLHIVTVRIDEHGNKLNDSFEHRRSKEITDQIELKYGLRHSSQSKPDDLNGIPPLDYRKGKLKQGISNTLKSLANYKFQSLKEYNALLSLYNITVEEVKGSYPQRDYHGIVYYVTDQKGNRKSVGFKSSLYGKQFGIAAIQKRIEQSKKQIDHITKEKLKYTINQTIQKSKSLDELILKLRHENIDMILRKNENGIIYGTTYIDHLQEIVINGSGLGKEYSANVISKLFTTNDQMVNTRDEQSLALDLIADLSIVRFLPLEAQGEDAEENAFTYRIKRQQRKKR